MAKKRAARYRRAVAAGQVSQDPATTVRDAPPNFGRMVVPQIWTFGSRVSSLAQVYRNPDEAVKDSPENARYMRNDPAIMECVEARQRAVALLNWHLEPEDEEDPVQKQLVDEMTAIIKQIPDFAEYRRNLLEAIWYGRYAVQHGFDFCRVKGVRRTTVKKWRPINGDKLAFRWDDGSGRFSDDDVGIRVGVTWSMQDGIAGQRTVEFTDFGPAYFLEPWERSRVAVHKHIIEDGAYEDPISAGRIHGVGVRDRIYWCWYQKQETMATLMEIIERTGSGFTIYYYPDGNQKAKTEVEEMAAKQKHDNILIMPRMPGDPAADAYGVERIEPNTAGISAMREIVHEFFGHQIKRYILGQILSSESAATGLGSGVADLHQDTFMLIVQYDATKLEETLTRDLVKPLLAFNFPKYRDVSIKFRIDTGSNESEKKMSGYKQAWDMGARIRAADVMDAIGASMPSEDEETLVNPTIMQQMRLWRQQQAAGSGGGEPGSVNDMFGPLAGMLGGDGASLGDQMPPDGAGPGGPGGGPEGGPEGGPDDMPPGPDMQPGAEPAQYAKRKRPVTSSELYEIQRRLNASLDAIDNKEGTYLLGKVSDFWPLAANAVGVPGVDAWNVFYHGSEASSVVITPGHVRLGSRVWNFRTRQTDLADVFSRAVGRLGQVAVERQLYRKVPTYAEITAAAEATEHPTSDDQRDAGNYRKGKIRWNGLLITIENAKGSKRRPEWKPLAHHYGYINRTEGRDGDHVDVFIGPKPKSDLVVIVDQVTEGGRFDEHKCLIGFQNKDEAIRGYLANYYQSGWKLGRVSCLTVAQFRAWLEDGDTSKPIAGQLSRYAKKRVKPAPGQMDLFGGGTVPKQHAIDWKEELHPRRDDGKFAPKGEGAKKLMGQVPAAVQADEPFALEQQKPQQQRRLFDDPNMPPLPLPKPKPGTDLFGSPLKGEFKPSAVGKDAGKHVQPGLFSTKGAPDQMNLFADKGVPDDLVAKPAPKTEGKWGDAEELHRAVGESATMGEAFISDVKKRLGWSDGRFRDAVQKARESGKLALTGMQQRGGFTPEQLAAGIEEGGSKRFKLAMRQPAPGETKSPSGETKPAAGETTAPVSDAKPADFAAQAQKIADAMPHGFGRNKVFISDVFDAMQAQNPSLTRDEFNRQLLAANRAGVLKLSRGDLVERMHPDDVERSETRIDGLPSVKGEHRPHFTFIQAAEADRADAQTRDRTGKSPVAPLQAPAAAKAPEPATPKVDRKAESIARIKQGSARPHDYYALTGTTSAITDRKTASKSLEWLGVDAATADRVAGEHEKDGRVDLRDAIKAGLAAGAPDVGLTAEERENLPEHLKNVNPAFPSEAAKLKDLARSRAGQPSLQGDRQARPASEFGFRGPAANKWSVDGVTIGDTPEKATEAAAALEQDKAEQADIAARYGQSIPKFVDGTYTDDDIKRITQFGNTTSSKGHAKELLRRLGLRPVDADGALKRAGVRDTTPDGASLYDVRQVIEAARSLGFIKGGNSGDKSPAPEAMLSEHILAGRIDDAVNLLSGLSKDEARKAAVDAGLPFANAKTKKEIVEGTRRIAENNTPEKRAAREKQDAIDVANRKARTAIDNAEAHAKGLLGAPIGQDVTDEQFKNPHAPEHKEAVAAAWRAEVAKHLAGLHPEDPDAATLRQRASLLEKGSSASPDHGDKHAQLIESGHTLEGKRGNTAYYRTPGGKEIVRVGKDGIARFESWAAPWDSLGKRVTLGNGDPSPDVLPGGQADRAPDSAFPADKLAEGQQHESEHTSEPQVAKEIAKDHLSEDGEYYDKLKAVEGGGVRDPLTKRSASQIVALQESLGSRKPKEGPEGVKTVRKLLSKHPAGKVLDALLATNDEHFENPDDYRGHGFPSPTEAMRKQIDRKFTKSELLAASRWASSHPDTDVNRFMRDSIRTARATDGEITPEEHARASQAGRLDRLAMAQGKSTAEETRRQADALMSPTSDELDALPSDSGTQFEDTLEEAKKSGVVPQVFDPESHGGYKPLLDIGRKVDAGEMSHDDYKAAYELYSKHGDAFKSDLMKRFDAKQLRNIARNLSSWADSGATKKENADRVYDRLMLNAFHVGGDAFTYGMEGMHPALAKHVAAQTADSLKAHAEGRKERQAAAQAAVSDPQTIDDFRQAAKAAGGYANLSPEHQAKYDDLVAKERRKQDASRGATVQAFTGGAESTGEVGIVEGHHKKRNAPTWTVTMEKHLGDKWAEVSSRAKKMGGNYVNAMTARNYGATQGFQFFSKDAAEKFANVLRGQNEDRSGIQQQREIGKIANASERLAALAAEQNERAQAELDKPRLANTSRRADMAAGAAASARAMQAQAETMHRLSEAMANGEAEHLAGVRHRSHLDAIGAALSRAKWNRFNAIPSAERPNYDKFHEEPYGPADVAHAEYPYPRLWDSDAMSLAGELAEIDGAKNMAALIKRRVGSLGPQFASKVGGFKAAGGQVVDTANLREHLGFLPPEFNGKSVRVHKSTDARLLRGKHAAAFTADKGKTWGTTAEIAVAAAFAKGGKLDLIDTPQSQMIKFTSPDEVQAMAAVARKLQASPAHRRLGDRLAAQVEDYQRLQEADIRGPHELRAALREYLKYRSPPKRESRVAQMERDLIGRKIPGFFPTPRPIVDDMIDRAGIDAGMSVLEPSAGKGDILDAIRERHPDAQSTGIELQPSLRELLAAKGHATAHESDFLQHQGQYDRIVMNPPFENGQDADHVQHAYKLLKPGGRLVAIMSEGPFFRQDKKAAAFREWLSEQDGESEQLPSGAFSGADAFRQTGVSTRIVTIDKPKE